MGKLIDFFGRKRDATPDGYRAFTRDYDVVVDGDALDDVLGKPDTATAEAFDAAWREFETGLAGLRTRVTLGAAGAATLLRHALPDGAARDTAVVLLVDQSGSMRG